MWPSALNLRDVVRLDAMSLDAAPEYDAVLLSPVAPLGTCSVVAQTSQDRTLSTTRASEVVSDPTNVMALECARRLRAGEAGPHRLASVHQVLRMQSVPRQPGRTRHFRMFALVEAGRAEPDDGFEVGAYLRIAHVYDRLLDLSGAAEDSPWCERSVVLEIGPHGRALAERVAAALESELPHLTLGDSMLGGPYYDGLRLVFHAGRADDQPGELGDIGRVDWLTPLTANASNRLVIGGFGLQLLATPPA